MEMEAGETKTTSFAFAECCGEAEGQVEVLMIFFCVAEGKKKSKPNRIKIY